MSDESFMKLCNELQPYIENNATRLRETISVECQIDVTLYYLADKGRMWKLVNSLGVDKSTKSKIVRRVT